MEAVRIPERASDVTWDYDAEADVLYVSIGAPRPAVGEDIGEGVVLRYDRDAKEMIGLTVVGLRQRLLQGIASVPGTESFAVHDKPEPGGRRP
jgi:uncharacterized protein YuzE